MMKIPEEKLNELRRKFKIVPIKHLETMMIKKAVKLCPGNLTKAAQLLGMSRDALYNRRLRMRANENKQS
jgi:DNA-binding NtrC family response regulator